MRIGWEFRRQPRKLDEAIYVSEQMDRIVHTDSWVMGVATKLADLAGVTKIAEHGQNMGHVRPVVTRVTPCTGASADASSAHKYAETDSASTTGSMRTRSSSSSQSTTRTPSHPNSKFDRRKRMGAVNNWRTKILLDTGANISVVSESFARKLRLRRRVSLEKKVDIQSIAKDMVYTQERAKVKLTLGWELVYEFDVWIMPHYAGVDVILGTDFMIPAGVRLDLFRPTMKDPE
ncbi:unnamed protein product [Phytophthora fragariaefolia]|uniref:Unnamed protein product n=1 Tax=Phytophthora fragariaefolia TaxID=1490495 RepID=A0A9W6WT02_9STRA|nr:unnamed protein product [Phytophthora fragariaefolia]